MVLIGMGVSYGVGDKGLCSVASPPPLFLPHSSLLAPHPAHPPILFHPFGQLSLNPANHRLGWSVGNQTGPWLCCSPTHSHRLSGWGGRGGGGGGYLANNLQHAGMQAKPGFWGKPKRLGSKYGHLFLQLVFNETRLLPLWSLRHISPHICHRLSNVHSLCHALQLVRSSFFVRNDICIHPLTRAVWGGQPSPLVAGGWGGRSEAGLRIMG